MDRPPPRKPEEAECCGQGCRTCVFYLYEQELNIWNKSRTECVAQQGDEECAAIMTSDNYVECLIESVEMQCDNVWTYTFSLPSNTLLTFTAGQHLVAREGGLVRPYTLISRPGTVSKFDVVIKLYDDGLMSRIIREKWNPGYKVSWRGPLGGLDYRENVYSDVVLIGAGTGVTPLYQLARLITDNAEDDTRVKLLYCCRNYREILLRPDLHRMQSYWNFTVRYFLSRDGQREADGLRKHNEDVTYSRLTEELLVNELSPALSRNKCLKVYLCGPKSFESHVTTCIQKLLDKCLIETF